MSFIVEYGSQLRGSRSREVTCVWTRQLSLRGPAPERGTRQARVTPRDSIAKHLTFPLHMHKITAFDIIVQAAVPQFHGFSFHQLTIGRQVTGAWSLGAESAPLRPSRDSCLASLGCTSAIKIPNPSMASQVELLGRRVEDGDAWNATSALSHRYICLNDFPALDFNLISCLLCGRFDFVYL